mmetsp:Transcript_27919/g.31364  ORF Transcript_27919/g.31364 Transcript_27919/m.31364 type:complete len:426 (-) Transcript_27919:257-1534(-)
MGASRRSRQAHHNSRHSSSDDSVSNRSKGSDHNQNHQDLAKANLDFNAALQEVDGDGGGEITLVLLIVVISVILALVIGVAAGMTISIHYFENQNPTVMLGGMKANPRDSPLLYSGQSGVYQKVTTLDPVIASSNIVQRNGLDLGKVITATATGQLNVLMVVDEITPLHSNSENTQHHIDTDKAANDYKSNVDYADGSKESKMTREQAETIAPGYSQWESSQPNIELRQPTALPLLCSDGVTLGFDSWAKLRTAVQEANSISAERYMKWNEYFATNSFTAFQDDRLYYEEDVIFSICPGTVLRARKGPIFINAENVVLECEGKCVVDVGGTHLAFGANAKNILIRGIAFRRASASSLTFFHDGADVSFEDCSWINEYGINNYIGSIANVNSTSIINFYRCEIGLGGKMITMGTSSATTNSLSIRV